MAGAIDLARLTEPVSDDEPCGPDLDIAGDATFMRVVAGAEGVLPASFFTRDDEGRQQVFDRSAINFPVELKRLGDLLQDTRDLRPLTLYGRLSALNRDIPGLGQVLAAVAALLDERWEAVHPGGEGGDYSLRSAVLQALDDMPTVVLPLQHVPLATHPRLGPISYRTVMTAAGEVAPREGEAVVDRAALSRAWGEVDLAALQATYGAVAAVRDAAALIQARTIEKAGYEQAVSLDRLSSLVGKIADVLAPVIAARDPSAASAPAAAGLGRAGAAAAPAQPAPPPAVGSVTSLAEAAAALAAAAAYFRRAEPSSPAEILVRQASQLVGKSFVEVLRVLLPSQADEMKIGLGPDNLFKLSFQQLVTASEAGDGAPEEDGARGSLLQPPPPVRAGTRPEAVELMRQVSLFYRGADPASPIPLLVDRASGLADRDFVSILKDVLPGLVAKDY